MYAIRLLIWIYSVISTPIFLILDSPLTHWLRIKSPRSHRLQDKKWVSSMKLISDPYTEYETVADLLQSLAPKHGDRQCLGYRQVLEIESAGRPSTGRTAGVVKKRLADEYTWLSFQEVDQTVGNMIRGFAWHGIQAGDKVLLALETRTEWLMTAMAIMRMGATLCTVYSTCGLDGVAHAVSETSSTHVITNQKICRTILNAVNQFPGLKKIIVVEDPLVSMDVTSRDGIQVVTLNHVKKDGQASASEKRHISAKRRKEINGYARLNGTTEHILTSSDFGNNNGHTNDFYFDHEFAGFGKRTVKPNDLALIMYTSGTTGVPKGVMYTHKSLLAAYSVVYSICGATSGPRFAFARDMNDIRTTCHLSYLPSAHIFELCMELFVLSVGASIGFGSPFTAFKMSPGLMKGTRGDAEVLNPSFTIAVPLVCERIKNSICDEVAKKSLLVQQLFHFGIWYKNLWNSIGFSTPLTDKILFEKTRRIFGKDLKCIVVGGAALGESTHQFLRSALNVTMVQGYGTTETFALTTVQNDFSYESDCGHLHYGVDMMIEDWDEGGYRSTDKPNPRGELIVGGKHISVGYFRREAETRESFFADDQDPDKRWFRTGDIVEVDQKLGTIKIIDRKKDLVKLMNGEFVALGRLESLFRNCVYASNLLVYGSSSYANTIVILVPDEAAVCKLVDDLELDPSLKHDLASMCQNEQIIDLITRSIDDIATRSSLSRVERPAKVILVPDQWTPENGLTTASLKNRRKPLVDKYADLIHRSYRSLTRS